MSLRWDFSTIADQISDVIQRAEADLRLEQAVYGLDTRDERELQELLATGLAKHHAVAREVHYPSSAGRKLTHRQRCDLVLTPIHRPLRSILRRRRFLMRRIFAAPKNASGWR